ncbi:hypothetical protein Fmac_032572 [Flemingia macrophylla]|uniref:Maturase K n=1 Tax=Flemingia macrophylla TaxID=520843 RepID=A0ABD1L5B2_9FABA
MSGHMKIYNDIIASSEQSYLPLFMYYFVRHLCWMKLLFVVLFQHLSFGYY